MWDHATYPSTFFDISVVCESGKEIQLRVYLAQSILRSAFLLRIPHRRADADGRGSQIAVRSAFPDVCYEFPLPPTPSARFRSGIAYFPVWNRRDARTVRPTSKMTFDFEGIFNCGYFSKSYPHRIQ